MAKQKYNPGLDSTHLIESYRTEVQPLFDDMDPQLEEEKYTDVCFLSLVCGWAIAKGLPLDQAITFSDHIRYKTELA